MRAPHPISALLARLRQRLPGRPTNSGAWLQLLRPELAAAPPALRPWLEPLVAAAGLLALVTLLGAASMGLVMLLGAAALALLILTQLFGIELELPA